MSELLMENQIKLITSKNGIDVYFIPTSKFTTNSITIYFFDNLNRENVTKNALLPYVLKSGSKKYKSITDINLYLESLYGSTFNVGITKNGEYQVVGFTIDYINSRYTNEPDTLYDKIAEFLFDIILNPLVKNECFLEEYVNIEKVNLKERIKSKINNKNTYAVERCLEHMCKGEPFEIYEDGYEDDVDKINGNSLYNYYKNIFLKKMPIKIYISGDEDVQRIRNSIEKFMNIERDSVIELKYNKQNKEHISVKTINEKMQVQQGKLTLGFRTNVYPESDDYYKLLVYNNILGGGIHSKLFVNVREKEGLAYYIFSKLERFKSLQIISCGIDIDKKDRAYSIILKQIDNIKKGSITDYEVKSSIKAIETSLYYKKDSMYSIVEFYMNQSLIGIIDSLDDITNKVKNVKKKDIIEISKNIRLDTIFILSNTQ